MLHYAAPKPLGKFQRYEPQDKEDGLRLGEASISRLLQYARCRLRRSLLPPLGRGACAIHGPQKVLSVNKMP